MVRTRYRETNGVLLVVACMAVLACALVGCAGSSSTGSDPYPPGTTDEIWKEPAQNVELEVHKEGEQDQTAATGAAESALSEVAAAGSSVMEDTESAETAAPMKLFIDGTEVAVVWEDNDSVAALQELANSGPLEVQMSMYGGFEQVGPLGADLPRNDEQTTTQAGDIVLYQGNQIVVFYGSNSWAYTRLGHIEGTPAEELAQLLGDDNVVLTVSLR